MIGPAGSGKTTIGRKISQNMSIPFISKDFIKELLFEELGWGDRQKSLKIGGIAYSILYYFIEIILKDYKPLVIDGNFVPQLDAEKIKKIKKNIDFIPIQINLTAEKNRLAKRFKKRTALNFRHPGHCEENMYDEIKDSLKRGYMETLDIEGEIINVNTTNLNRVNYDEIIKNIEDIIQNN